MCVFARHNVLTDPPFSRMNLISCRNVLIYMDPMLQRKVVPLLHYALKRGGFLWLGSSETIGAFSDTFEVEDPKHRIYWKAAAQEPPGLPVERSAWDHPQRRHPLPRPTVDARPSVDSQREADRLAVARYAPPGVLIDQTLEIVQFRGDTSPYLASPPGRPSLNLLKMAREGLMVGLRTVVQKAMRTGIPSRKEGLRVRANGVVREFDVQIFPIKGKVQGERFFLVQFEDHRNASVALESLQRVRGKSKETGATGAAARSRSERAEQEIASLSEELSSTREYMQTLIEQQEAANEELQSANEEVQSSNEELQSVNEELQTSKEEIQSSNEELTTVNEELRNRNEELSESNADLKNFLASTHLALVMLASDLKIRSFTPQAGKLLQLLPTDVGRPISNIKPPFQVDIEKHFADALESMHMSEEEVQDAEGHWFSLRVRPYQTAHDRVEGAVLVLVDIDSQKRAVEDLRQADKRKDEFLATLAHELRNPLTTLSLGFEAARRDGSGSKTKRLEAMERQVEKLTHLVDDLLEVSRIGRGTINLRAAKLDLADLVGAAATSMRPRIEERGQQLSVTVPGHSVPVDGDAVRLDQVVTNLLSNAMKFTDPGGKIKLELSVAGSGQERKEAVLSVADEGIGIDAAVFPRVFDMFTQAQSSSGRDHGGLGVGLFLVRRLVELHGGRVTARSAGLGKGSEFIVRLPVRPEMGPDDDDASKKPTPVPVDPDLRRVLVVDDNADAADTVAMIFEMDGYEVRMAHNGPEALEVASSFKPQTIFMDIGMPGMDGHQVARKIRENPEFDDVALIALSGYGQEDDRHRSLEAGFDEHLVKPSTWNVLHETLARFSSRSTGDASSRARR
jgi:two-component system, chemotaxis family, CheB/CheR fusion protein